MTILDLLKYAFAAYLTVDFVRYARKGTVKRHFSVFAGRGIPEWIKALAMASMMLGVLYAIIMGLYSLNNPILSFSWLNLLKQPADGKNAGTNLVAAGAQVPYFGIVFGALLALNIPRLVRREEEIFRRGTTTWAQSVPRSIKFGFAHMIVGVPIFGALALTVVGFFFTWRYFVGGVREATFYHCLNNLLVLTLVAVVMLTG
ncbi:MAG: hypothetical protein JNM85_06115 [Chthonomonas sp.]|nr:hypothetical protein [Chthonomonas sp.]